MSSDYSYVSKETPIKAVVGGKQMGLGSWVTIDPAVGCIGTCKGCYAAKATRLGQNFHRIVRVKRMDEKELKKSILSCKKKGFNHARVGKSCDPGAHLKELQFIMDIATELEFHCVVVSKFLIYKEKLAKSFVDGGHTLHMSLGMDGKYIPSDRRRELVALRYFGAGVNASLRICEDVTKPYPEDLRTLRNHADIPEIITPYRYTSKDSVTESGSDINDFEFIAGYWKPVNVHESWSDKLKKGGCGLAGDKYYCCNCMVLNKPPAPNPALMVVN